MINAVLKNGVIWPLDPLPSEWTEGCALVINEAYIADSTADLALWNAEVDELAGQVDPADFDRLDRALAEAKAQAKAMVRREMGLP